eukprot:1145311-Pelagomonas_calceolata.AAC.2
MFWRKRSVHAWAKGSDASPHPLSNPHFGKEPQAHLAEGAWRTLIAQSRLGCPAGGGTTRSNGGEVHEGAGPGVVVVVGGGAAAAGKHGVGVWGGGEKGLEGVGDGPMHGAAGKAPTASAAAAAAALGGDGDAAAERVRS